MISTFVPLPLLRSNGFVGGARGIGGVDNTSAGGEGTSIWSKEEASEALADFQQEEARKRRREALMWDPATALSRISWQRQETFSPRISAENAAQQSSIRRGCGEEAFQGAAAAAARWVMQVDIASVTFAQWAGAGGAATAEAGACDWSSSSRQKRAGFILERLQKSDYRPFPSLYSERLGDWRFVPVPYSAIHTVQSLAGKERKRETPCSKTAI
ncbi:hypothetical protein BHM03_00022829 [Ensete ventricosum]|nr:hypothetical protein BHM03_00022829 [Ensete ventricosum]